MPEHSAITDPDIHEIKNASTAAINTVPVSDGAGSHSWAKLGASSMSTASIFNTNKFHVTLRIADVATAGTLLLPLPMACTLTRVTTILHGTIATADEVLTLTNSTGPAAIGTITITASGSAEGDIDQLSPASNTAFTANTYLKIANSGASTNTVALTLFFEFTRTG